MAWSMSNSGIAGPAAAVLLAGATLAAAEPSPMRQKELIHMVRQDCGSCHGLTLQGGLGPALLPQTLAGKPAEGLVATIVQGRPGTAMPPWHRFLAEDEAHWIVARLMEGFPN
jgi:cytochrome c55X